MKCDVCGATIPEGATTCPVCGAPVPESAAPAELDEQGPAAAVDDGPGAVPAPVAPRKRTWVVWVAIVAVLAVLGAGGYLIYSQMQSQATPQAAALRMMSAYAAYDAKGILDNATHESLTATDEITFAQQAADGKTQNKGLPAVKDMKITKVTMDSETTATIQMTAQWLTDAATSKYTAREEILTVIRQNGKWLVVLFR